ncbi:hypothetical protein BC833DRAFT_18679 [Globomyces pollinis-pini]|nr:hypothetical protein BC833DRAFT_18679 [Globomyces pollinis-pini]
MSDRADTNWRAHAIILKRALVDKDQQIMNLTNQLEIVKETKLSAVEISIKNLIKQLRIMIDPIKPDIHKLLDFLLYYLESFNQDLSKLTATYTKVTMFQHTLKDLNDLIVQARDMGDIYQKILTLIKLLNNHVAHLMVIYSKVGAAKISQTIDLIKLVLREYLSLVDLEGMLKNIDPLLEHLQTVKTEQNIGKENKEAMESNLNHHVPQRKNLIVQKLQLFISDLKTNCCQDKEFRTLVSLFNSNVYGECVPTDKTNFHELSFEKNSRPRSSQIAQIAHNLLVAGFSDVHKGKADICEKKNDGKEVNVALQVSTKQNETTTEYVKILTPKRPTPVTPGIVNEEVVVTDTGVQCDDLYFKPREIGSCQEYANESIEQIRIRQYAEALQSMYNRSSDISE